MIEIKQGTGKVVAADAQAMATSLDQALLHQARLCATLIEAAADTRVGIGVSQPVLEAVANGMAKLVDSRASVAIAIKTMTSIQQRSNLAEVSFGCPGGWFRTPAPSFASAENTTVLELAA